MLGKGHDGMCYLCEDLENRELVAVKVCGGCRRAWSRSKASFATTTITQVLNPKRNRKVTEPVLMAGLDHKHIIRMRDHFMVRGFNFLVIDYCDKGDLCDYVYENEYLDEAEARKILLQLVKGVRYLHDRGICHRDLKLVRARRPRRRIAAT
jgi:serine/threonine protein kinase